MKPVGERNWDFYNDFSYTPKEFFDSKEMRGMGINDIVSKAYGLSISAFCGQVLAYFIYLVVLDIIENNLTFEFPLTGKHRAYIYVKCYQGEELNHAIRYGAFIGIDFVKSGFKAYRLCYQRVNGNKIYNKSVYISYNLKRWFYDKVNSGKQYY